MSCYVLDIKYTCKYIQYSTKCHLLHCPVPVTNRAMKQSLALSMVTLLILERIMLARQSTVLMPVRQGRLVQLIFSSKQAEMLQLI